MNTKICTSIEQSKKLLELGLDPSTADMLYQLHEREYADAIRISLTKEHWNSLIPDIYPAWSLAALLGLMPVCIGDDNYFLVIEKDANYLNEPIWRVIYQHYLKNDAIAEQRKAPLINAAFEMICWLIEQKHIKVNK